MGSFKESISTPAASVLLVHGAGSGPDVFDAWRGRFAGSRCESVDLQGSVAPDNASMRDYADVVVAEGRRLARPLALCGWSMGGLVAWMAAEGLRPEALILIEPSPPLEVQGGHPEIPLEHGTFDPEEVYGPFPEGFTARPESLLARAERKRGISVPVPACPCLVISGREFGDARGRAIAERLGATELAFPDLNHWELVTDGRVVDAVAGAVGL